MSLIHLKKWMLKFTNNVYLFYMNFNYNPNKFALLCCCSNFYLSHFEYYDDIHYHIQTLRLNKNYNANNCKKKINKYVKLNIKNCNNCDIINQDELDIYLDNIPYTIQLKTINYTISYKYFIYYRDLLNLGVFPNNPIVDSTTVFDTTIEYFKTIKHVLTVDYVTSDLNALNNKFAKCEISKQSLKKITSYLKSKHTNKTIYNKIIKLIANDTTFKNYEEKHLFASNLSKLIIDSDTHLILQLIHHKNLLFNAIFSSVAKYLCNNNKSNKFNDTIHNYIKLMKHTNQMILNIIDVINLDIFINNVDKNKKIMLSNNTLTGYNKFTLGIIKISLTDYYNIELHYNNNKLCKKPMMYQTKELCD